MDLTMPRLSDTMEEGTVGRWLKAEGETIQKGEVIAEIQTDKANMELEAFQGGVLQRILVQEGGTVAIGEPIAVIGSADGGTDGQSPRDEARAPDAAATASPAEAPEPEPGRPSSPSADGEGASAPARPEGRLKASPAARRIAQELGLDLGSVRGSGPHGRIVREDVQRAASAQPAAPPPTIAQPEPPAPAPAAVAQPAAASVEGELQSLTRVQAIIAQRMLESKTQVPHFYVSMDIEMSEAMALRQTINALGDVQVSFNDIVVKGCALALAAKPLANGAFTPEGFRLRQEINVGVAVATPDSLIVPVVHDADKKPLRTIAAETRELARKARENKLSPSDLSGGTFTVSNLGMFGVADFVAIINQPESAILAVAAIQQQPVIRGGKIMVGNVMRVTLSADHRILYGSHAAEFLQELKRLLESPLNLGF
jgi:pyruvate dehydrogenase E2 component (dihydrolipoamide acetyltransferase)